MKYRVRARCCGHIFQFEIGITSPELPQPISEPILREHEAIQFHLKKLLSLSLLMSQICGYMKA